MRNSPCVIGDTLESDVAAVCVTIVSCVVVGKVPALLLEPGETDPDDEVGFVLLVVTAGTNQSETMGAVKPAPMQYEAYIDLKALISSVRSPAPHWDFAHVAT